MCFSRTICTPHPAHRSIINITGLRDPDQRSTDRNLTPWPKFLCASRSRQYPYAGREGIPTVTSSVALQWAALDAHFQHHTKLVRHFRHAGADAVVRMWMSQTNEAGERLSQFERDALIERHCELFGTWPD